MLGSAPPAEPAPSLPPAGTVVFGGDVIPHGSVLEAFEKRGAASLYEAVAPVVKAADVALVNLETPVAPSRMVRRMGLRFNVHAEFAQALVDVGFDGASVANNHSYDQGVAAVGETVSTLRSIGLRPVGGALAGEDPLAPQEFPLAGSTLCVFAATRLHNRPPEPEERRSDSPRVGSVELDDEREERALVNAVGRHREHCGAVMVSLHGGREYRDEPMDADRKFFHRVAEAGADVIIGHHSHTPQPIEVYVHDGRRVPIYYSLGNFLSAQGYAAEIDVDPRRWDDEDEDDVRIAHDPRLREGLLAVLRFRPGSDGRLALEQYGYLPLWTVNTAVRHVEGEGGAIAATLMPRGGGDDPFLVNRWRDLLGRVGPDYALDVSAVPGALAAYAASDYVQGEGRRALAALSGSNGPQLSLR